MALTPKTIYLEADEEITSVIDKIRKTDFSDIVLVIPKEASITQSVVNLKLIKKKAESLNKAISIVTADKVARTLAEKIGIVAAATLGGLDVVSVVSPQVNEEATPLQDTDEVIFNKETVPGNLASESDELSISEADDVEEEIEEKDSLLHEIEGEGKREKLTKSKSLTPQFPWKKIALFAGIPLFIILIISYVYLPRAKATIFMKSEGKPVSINITGEKDVSVDAEKAVVSTQVLEVSKEGTNKFTATGAKDAGTKATGTVEVYYAVSSVDWVAGTRIALGSDSSLIYKTTTALHAPKSTPTQVKIEAEGTGEKYNIDSGKTFLAINDSGPTITSVTAMTGGTTKQITVVSQSDFDKAKESLSKNITGEVDTEFATKASEVKVIENTEKIEVASATASPAVGQEASEFTLTVKVSAKALAISNEDIATIIKAEVDRQLGSTREIIDNGSEDATLVVDSADLETGKFSGTVTTTAYVASKLDQENIKAELTGLNNTQATNYLMALEGVDSVDLSYFPSFIRSFPRIKKNISLIITVADSSRK